MQLFDGKLLLSPSDLSNYLACPHLTTLELETAHTRRTKPHIREALAQLVADKGDLHERRYLEYLRAGGREILEVELTESPGAFGKAHAVTVAAMRAGVEVVYQATFARGGW